MFNGVLLQGHVCPGPPTDLLWQQEGGLGGEGGVMEHDRGQTPQTQIGYPPVSADSV